MSHPVPAGGRFAGRVALVTGAGSPTGIGFATARQLGLEGASVAIASSTDRIHERATELAGLGIDGSGHVGDLRDQAAADRIRDEVIARHGSLDVLVANAGMVVTLDQQGAAEDSASGMSADHDAGDGRPRSFVTTPVDAWDRELALSLTTAVTMTRAALPAMIRAGYGRIVLVSSVTGPLVANPGDSAYAAAKAALTGFMRALALETASQGITVNAVLPGWIATGSQLPEESVAGANTPIGRSGTPDEVAEAIAFLASEGARYVTGQTLVVDGGNIVQEYKGPASDWY